MAVDFNEYLEFVFSTAKTPYEEWFEVSILGLTEEVAEYISDPTPEELGDVLWYLFHFMNLYTYKIPLFYLDKTSDNMLTNLGILCGMCKKRITHNPEPYSDGDIVKQCNKLMWCINVEANVKHGLTLGEVMEINKKKIRDRIKNNTLLTINR